MTTTKFDSAGNPCNLLYVPAGETRWTPSKDGVLVEFCGAGCAVKSTSRLVGWPEVAKRAAGNPAFAAPWAACLAARTKPPRPVRRTLIPPATR